MKSNLKKISLLLFIIIITINVLYASNTNNTSDMVESKIETKSLERNISIEKIQTPVKKSEDDNLIITITKDTFHDYFNEYGEADYTKFKNNTTLYFYSIPQNTEEIILESSNNPLNMENMTIIGKDNFTLNNTAFIINSNHKNFNLCNITLNYNEKYDYTEHLIINSLNNNDNKLTLENININCTQNAINDFYGYYNHAIYPLKVSGNNMILNNIQICSKLPSNTISYQGTNNKPNSIALYIEGNNITLNNSNITLVEKYKDIYSNYNTIYALYNEAENFIMTNTQIFIEGEEYVYAVVSRSSENKIYNNNITAKSIVYSAGINIEGSKIKNNLITNNTINITAGHREQGTTSNGAEDSAYGLLLLDYSYKGGKFTPNSNTLNNNTYTYNKITGSAGNIYAIEVYGGANTNLSNNNINITGRTPMGIGTIGENVSITNNNITCTGETNNTEGSADYLKPRTTGIYTYLSSTGINIEHNNIKTTNGRGIYIEQTNNTIIQKNIINTTQYDYTIEITGTNNTAKENQLISRNHEANNSIRTTNQENNIQDNTNILPPPTPNTITITTTQNKDNTLTITATIQNTNNTINKGKITFKVNGKTLKDANGKVIYAKVVGGVAIIENYIVPDDWANDGSTIQAIYSGSTDCEKLTSEKTNITVATPEPTLVITPITSDVQTGSTITLKAKVAAGDKTITTGKIVFKVNGKTVKDASGKVIYAKVDANGEVSVDYTIPESYKAGNYTIEAVFTASGYDKLIGNTTLTVVKA